MYHVIVIIKLNEKKRNIHYQKNENDPYSKGKNEDFKIHSFAQSYRMRAYIIYFMQINHIVNNWLNACQQLHKIPELCLPF